MVNLMAWFQSLSWIDLLLLLALAMLLLAAWKHGALDHVPFSEGE